MTAVAGITYPFTQEEAEAAFNEWGCNCGPTALGFALQLPLSKIRPLILGFDEKRYTSPSMMKAALLLADKPYSPVRFPTKETMFDNDLFRGRMSLVRIQWTGPWTAPDANPRWAYRQTHWITTWTERGVPLLFDCNGGIRGPDSWESEIVPVLTESIPRADGGWFPTHCWRLSK